MNNGVTIFHRLSEQLAHLKNTLTRLTAEQFTYQCGYLGGATIGQHSRHILELLACVVTGYELGAIDYVNRVRDLSLETDLHRAILKLEELECQLQRPDKMLLLAGEGCDIATSFYREIVYNMEHTVHHLAIMKVPLLELGLDWMDQNYGMAYSTINYRKEQQKS